jgi:hypothetical protein
MGQYLFKDFYIMPWIFCFIISPEVERDHLEGLSVDRRILLKCVLNKYVRGVLNELIWFRVGRVQCTVS